MVEPAYRKMAEYYDRVYHRLVDYEADCDFLGEVFQKHSPGRVETILDVGCGTGNHAYVLTRRGYGVTGIDLSPEMIRIAGGKRGKTVDRPRFSVMDMRRFDLGQNFDAVLSLFGGFGYMHVDSEVSGFMRSVKKHLRDRGLLVFEFWHASGLDPDASTPAGRVRWVRIVEEDLGQVIVRLDRSLYDAQTNLLTMTMDHYVLDIVKRALVDTFTETHIVGVYSISEMKHLLTENGLTSVAFYDGDGDKKAMKPASHASFRVIGVATSTAGRKSGVRGE